MLDELLLGLSVHPIHPSVHASGKFVNLIFFKAENLTKFMMHLGKPIPVVNFKTTDDRRVMNSVERCRHVEQRLNHHDPARQEYH